MKFDNSTLNPFVVLTCLFFFVGIFPQLARSQDRAKMLEYFTKIDIGDKDWLTFGRRFGITEGGIQDKLPILKSELDLTPEQLDGFNTLISKLENEELIARTLDHEETAEETQPSPVKKNKTIIFELQQKLQKAQSDSLNEVVVFRNLLGEKDLDFRFWLLEENVIYKSEWTAYSKNHNYSPDDLADVVVDSIRKSPVFAAFKKIKMNTLSSSQVANQYFEIRMNLVKKRVLFQNFRYRSQFKRQKDFKNHRDNAYEDISLLCEQLNGLK